MRLCIGWHAGTQTYRIVLWGHRCWAWYGTIAHVPTEEELRYMLPTHSGILKWVKGAVIEDFVWEEE
jgi:hypothetical protein